LTIYRHPREKKNKKRGAGLCAAGRIPDILDRAHI
jgi:hypothetical protein